MGLGSGGGAGGVTTGESGGLSGGALQRQPQETVGRGARPPGGSAGQVEVDLDNNHAGFMKEGALGREQRVRRPPRVEQRDELVSAGPGDLEL